MFVYKPRFIPQNFVIVGAGGTGGRLVPLLSQFLKTVHWITPKIYLIDFDTVEDKNLKRQNFITPDVGRPKAVVLAERYNFAYDSNIIPVVEKIGSEGILLPNCIGGEKSIPLRDLVNTVVILCVDSVTAREHILAAMMNPPRDRAFGRNLIIDAGNEDTFGQVVFYNLADYEGDTGSVLLKAFESTLLPGGGMPYDCEIPEIPFPRAFYEELRSNYDANAEAQKAGSCADLDQTLAINAMIATTIMGVVQTFVYRLPITTHRLNVSLMHGTTARYLDARYLLESLHSARQAVASRGKTPSPSEKALRSCQSYAQMVDSSLQLQGYSTYMLDNILFNCKEVVKALEGVKKQIKSEEGKASAAFKEGKVPLEKAPVRRSPAGARIGGADPTQPPSIHVG